MRYTRVEVVAAEDFSVKEMWERFVVHNLPVVIHGGAGGAMWEKARAWTDKDALARRAGSNVIKVRRRNNPDKGQGGQGNRE